MSVTRLRLHDIELVDASVASSATFAEAALALSESGLSALAVLAGGRVVGLFTDEELLLGSSPRYLDELEHTAFLERELPSLRERALAADDDRFLGMLSRTAFAHALLKRLTET